MVPERLARSLCSRLRCSTAAVSAAVSWRACRVMSSAWRLVWSSSFCSEATLAFSALMRPSGNWRRAVASASSCCSASPRLPSRRGRLLISSASCATWPGAHRAPRRARTPPAAIRASRRTVQQPATCCAPTRCAGRSRTPSGGRARRPSTPRRRGSAMLASISVWTTPAPTRWSPAPCGRQRRHFGIGGGDGVAGPGDIVAERSQQFVVGGFGLAHRDVAGILVELFDGQIDRGAERAEHDATEHGGGDQLRTWTGRWN